MAYVNKARQSNSNLITRHLGNVLCFYCLFFYRFALLAFWTGLGKFDLPPCPIFECLCWTCWHDQRGISAPGQPCFHGKTWHPLSAYKTQTNRFNFFLAEVLLDLPGFNLVVVQKLAEDSKLLSQKLVGEVHSRVHNSCPVGPDGVGNMPAKWVGM